MLLVITCSGCSRYASWVSPSGLRPSSTQPKEMTNNDNSDGQLSPGSRFGNCCQVKRSLRSCPLFRSSLLSMTGQWCGAEGTKGQSPAHRKWQLLKDHPGSGTTARISLSLCWDYLAFHPSPCPVFLPSFLHKWTWGTPRDAPWMQICVSKSLSQRTYKTSSFFSILKGINEVSYQNAISLKRILWFFQ